MSRVPQPVYEHFELQNRCIKGQFYNYVLVKVTVLPETEYQIDNIVRIRNKNCIKYLVKWKDYDEIFNSWVNVPNIKKM
jgi:hypothetical protein